MRPGNLIRYILIICLLPFILNGCTSSQPVKIDFHAPVEYAPIYVQGLIPSQVDEKLMRPGLSTVYYLDFFKRDLKHLPAENDTEDPGKKGKPIPYINHQFKTQPVFDSGTNRGVGMRMTGYIHFGETGIYEMQAISNDGMNLYIDNKLLITDPIQHSDRLSNTGFVTIDKPGWYTMKLEYFQRKGTAALKLFWKTPSSPKQVVVPGSAFRYKP